MGDNWWWLFQMSYVILPAFRTGVQGFAGIFTERSLNSFAFARFKAGMGGKHLVSVLDQR
jgi:hypothetical protein